MTNILLIIFGKIVSFVSRLMNLGNGSTWPGHIALSLDKNFIKTILKNSSTKIILIAGTNGKTTTSKLIRTILEHDGKTVLHNESGANLLNGIASTLILHCNKVGRLNCEYGIFEVDENSLPLILNELTPDYLLLLNLFRDQLDRYGEVNSIAKKWHTAIQNLPTSTTILLNVDDPQIASLDENIKAQAKYFGLDDKNAQGATLSHAVDSTYCLNCGNKLTYKKVFFSHLGDWYCKNCGNKREKLDLSNSPYYPLFGMYNKYNTNAAVLLAHINDINNEAIEQSLKKFKPAFGRQEIVEMNGKKVQLFLSKNPTSMNESLRTVSQLQGKHLLFVLNDRIPDGRDVSWIWDVDFEEFLNHKIDVSISGDRAYDMGLRLKYALQNQNSKVKIYESLQKAIRKSIQQLSNNNNEVLYILPTYSAMLDVRKILTGRKIL